MFRCLLAIALLVCTTSAGEISGESFIDIEGASVQFISSDTVLIDGQMHAKLSGSDINASQMKIINRLIEPARFDIAIVGYDGSLPVVDAYCSESTLSATAKSFSEVLD